MIRHKRFAPNRLFAITIGIVAIALSVPPMRALIEQSMVWHMAIQMPMLVMGGWFAMSAFFNRRASALLAHWNRYGLTGFIAAQVIVAYWMLPLAIDRAIVLPQADAMKVVTLFVSGAMLKHSVERSPPILQLFFVGYAASMMIWLGIYFASTDLRLCNAYSLESQAIAGRGIALWGITLGFAWLIGAIRQLKDARLEPRTQP